MIGAKDPKRLSFASILVPLIASVMLGSPRTSAQSNDARSPDRPDLTLNYLDAYLEMVGEFGFTRVESPRHRGLDVGRKQRNTEWRFEERVGLRFGGTVIDPSFITFGGEFSFALTQDRFHENTDLLSRTDRDRGVLLQYDLRADFFPGKARSGSVYALRRDNRIGRRFQPSLREDRTEFGTHWLVRGETVSMELSYDYRETDRIGNADAADDEHYTESTLRYVVEWLISDTQRIELSYEHANNKQAYQGSRNSFETTRDLVIVEHQLEFGEAKQHELRTRLRWQEESGNFARDFFEIGPQLTLQHSDNLQTRYTYQFNRQRYEGLDVESQRMDFQLVHQMYSNLTTTLDLFALYEDVEDDINTVQYGGSIDFQYNRRNRWGHLYANLALAYDTEEVDGDNGLRIVLNEAHAFQDPIAVTLRNRNVVHHTIVVTDTSNRRLFRAGIDYVVLAQGNVTRISRIRSGLIADGDSVLVDYQIRTPQHGQLDTVRVDFSLEQRFANGLTPYYRLTYRHQEDDVSFGFLRRADRTNHHRIGFNYEQKRYTLGAWFEIFDDSVEPYDAFHLNGLYRFINTPDDTLNGSVRFSRLFFEGGFDDRNVTLIDLELDHRRRLTDSLSTVERVAYRLEDDSVSGQTHAWDITAGLEYVLGELTCELTFEYDRLELPGSKEDDFGVYVRVRREFPHVLGK